MSAPRLAFHRSRANRVLTASCVINSVTQTEGDMGGSTDSLTPGATVACRIRPVTGNERIVAGAVVEDATAVVQLPAGTAITPQSVITSGGRTFYVVYIAQPTDELLRTCFVSERIS